MCCHVHNLLLQSQTQLMSVANSVCLLCCVYVKEERDSSKTKELSTDTSQVSVGESSSHTVCELNCSVCLMNKFVEMQERSF